MPKFYFKVPVIVQDVEGNDYPFLSEDKRILEIIENAINEGGLEYYFHRGEWLKRITCEVSPQNEAIIICETKKEPKNAESILKQFLDGQMSDGWGEGFEQQSHFLKWLGLTVYIKLWNAELSEFRGKR